MRHAELSIILSFLGICGCGQPSVPSREGDDDPSGPPRDIPLLFIAGDLPAGRAQLHALDLDGGPRQLGAVDCPFISEARTVSSQYGDDLEAVVEPSPDGRFVAWASHRCSDTSLDATLEIVDTAGGKPSSIVTREFSINTRITWSPDGRWLVVHSWDEHDRVIIASPNGETRVLLDTPGRSVGFLTWAPDSSKLVYGIANGQQAVHLHTLSLDGDVREVARDVHVCWGGGPQLWSPDGTRLLYVDVPAETDDLATAVARYRTTRADGTDTLTVLELPWRDYPPERDSVVDFRCKWSKDSDAVLVLTPDQLVLAGAQDGSARVLAEAATSFSWSPRESHVVYGSVVGGSQLMRTVGVDGENQREWVAIPYAPLNSPSWSWGAEGRYAAFSYDFSSSTDTHIADVDTGHELLLSDCFQAALSPDDTRVMCQRYLGPVSMNLDGSDERPVPSGIFGYMADGRHIAAAQADNLWFQSSEEAARVVWEGSADLRLVSLRFPIHADPSERRYRR